MACLARRLALGLALFLVFRCSVASGVKAVAANADDAGPTRPIVPESMRNDAQLADVFFADAARGWAVGDRGTIWHTADGGRRWAPQESGVDCRLSSVFFLDGRTGWAAGGYIQPYTSAATGVVLRTRDVGQHWTVDPKLVLPAIGRLRFFDARHGWAIGQTSAFFPSGVYATEDGGRSWSPLPASEPGSWLTGDFTDPTSGALAGRSSALAAIRRRGIEPLAADYGLRGLRQMKLVAPAGGWLVGDGGLILKTQDLGHSWQTPEGDVPPAIRDHFDFDALDVRGPHCWIAGTPGSRVLHSAVAGRTWSVHPTGQTLPIRSLMFVDERHGWAVGDLGVILSTDNGGQTWQRQRGGGARTAFVGFYGRAAEIPLELIARLSADEGYLGTVEILNRQDVEARAAGELDPQLQAHEASVQAGASAAAAAWRFPLRQASLRLSGEQLVALWNQANDTQALEKLEAHIVTRVRMWRPSVVFTSAPDARAVDPLAHVINQVVLRAVERAADPARYPEQIAEGGLDVWKVQKVYGSLAPGQTGTSNVNTAHVAARLGRSIGELAAPARSVMNGEFSVPVATVGYRLLVDHIPQEVGQRDFFSGIPLAPGGEARRRLDEVSDRDMEALGREVQMRRNLQAMLAQAESADGADGRFVAGIGEQTRKMAPARAAEVLFQLAERYFRQGQWGMAAECFDMVVERYPDQPLATQSLVWLIQYYASGEAAWRYRAAHQIAVRQVSAQSPALDPQSGGQPKGQVRRAGGISAPAQMEGGNGLVRESVSSESRLAKASGYAKQLEALRPALFVEPAVRFPLAVAQRGQGLPAQAQRYWLAMRHNRPHDAWWNCAQGELWLGDGKGLPPKELWNCTRGGRPRLDGRLDEPMWRAASSVTLRSPQRDDADWGAVAMLSYDDEFLYLAVSCTKAEGFKYVKSDEPRPRDPDLADQDRVDVVIDLDRDFSSYYRLTIDHRGWTGEGCWHDTTWNPNWFVASGGDDGVWTAEAAIAWSELTGEPPTAKKTWAIGVQRTVPGVGFQSWTTPASTEIMPEGLGYLMFQ